MGKGEKVMKKNNFFDKLEENVIAVGIIIMVVMETLNVLFRIFVPSMKGVPEELAVFAYTFVCFLCASYCTKTGKNIIVDVLTTKYKKKVQKSLKVIEYSLDSIVSILFLYGSVVVVMATKASGKVGITGIPLWIIYTAPLFGFGLNLIRNIQNIIIEVNKSKNNNVQQVEELVVE